MDLTVDINAEGIQAGFIRVPNSSNRSAYGFMPVPVVVARKGAGPTALLTAAVHGDEYEGPLLLTRLIQSLEALPLTGRLIILPVVNLAAFQAGTRNSSVDEINFNRGFGGASATGSSDKLLCYIEHKLMDEADFAIDFHSGGRTLNYGQQASVYRTEDGEAVDLGPKRHALAADMGLPVGLIYKTAVGEGGSLLSAAARRGIPAIATELGGSGITDQFLVDAGYAALIRVLARRGLLPGDPEGGSRTQFYNVHGMTSCIFADGPGIFAARVACGDHLQPGQEVGAIVEPERPWLPAQTIRATAEGTVLALRAMPQTSAGDCLVQWGSAL